MKRVNLCWMLLWVVLTCSVTAHEVKILPLGESILPIIEADDHVLVTPSSLEFVDAPVGSPIVRQLTVQNVSNETQNVTITTEAGPFHLVVAPGDESFTLLSSQQAAVDLIYTAASASELLNASVTVTATDPSGRAEDVAVTVTGSAVEESASLAIVDPVTGSSIASLVFDTPVGSRDSRTIRLVNDGDLPVSGSISGLGPLGGVPCWWDVCFWRADNSTSATPYDLPSPGDFLDIEVTFAPVREWGITSTQLDFLGGDSPRNLLVQVQATEPAGEDDEIVVDAHLILSTPGHDFGTVPPGQNASTTVRLTNAGTETAWVELLGLDASHCAFAVCFESPGVNLSGFSLTAGAWVDLEVRFEPTAEQPPFALAAHFVGGAEPAVFSAAGSAEDTHGGFNEGETLTPVPLDLEGFRGMVNDNTFLSSTELDNVNLMTGNLVANLPIGPRFRIGPQLTHGLTLSYNASAWDATTAEDGLPWGNNIRNPMSAPAYGTNSGLGWRLSLGALYERDGRFATAQKSVAPHWPNRTQNHDWLYVAPDGSRIYFTSSGGGVYTSHGGSFLRLKESGGQNPMTLEFPDGSEHEFEKTDDLCDLEDRCWRLRWIRDAFGNEAEVRYIGFGSNTPSIEIRYPHARTSRIELSKTKAAAGSADLGDLRTLVTRVTVPKFDGGLAAYDFLYAGDSGAQASGPNEPDYQSPIVRGCPANVQAPDQQRMSVPILRNLRLPTGDEYVFSYNVDTAGGPDDGCDTQAGTLSQIALPTGAQIHYQWASWSLPALCSSTGDNPEPGALRLSAPFSLSPGVVQRRLVNAAGEPGPWTEYLPQEEEYQDHLTDCNRFNVRVTDVAHGPNLGSSDAPLYRVERYYHSTTKSRDIGQTWQRAAYGLPIHQGMTATTDAGETVWLSSETAECPSANFDDSGCEIQRRAYKHYRWPGDGSDSPCHNEPFVERPACRRAADAMDLERRTFGPQETWWVDARHSDYDGRGHYRHHVTRSNFNWSSGTETTTSETTQYFGGSVGSNDTQVYVSTPAANQEWLLHLFTEKRTNSDGLERVEQYDFDPADGFLRCRRTLKELVSPGAAAQRSNADVAWRFDRGRINGFTYWEEVAGGDGGNLSTGGGVANMCPDAASAFDYRTQHSYTLGERWHSQPKSTTSADLGPPTLHRQIDASTGLTSAFCAFVSNPATCEKYTYDRVGRLEVVDRGWELNGTSLREKTSGRFADTFYTYETTDGGSLLAEVKTHPTATPLQKTQLFFDGLGRETDVHVQRLANGQSRIVKQPSHYHPRGFRTAQLTPQLERRDECIENSLCRNTFRYDVYGRVIHTKSPALNRSAESGPMPGWVTPEAEETHSVSWGDGLVHRKWTRQFFCSGSSVTQEVFDHLDRSLGSQVSLEGMDGGNCPPIGLRRRTLITYANGVTTTTRDPGQPGGPVQVRIETQDGRGFLTDEVQPEWQDGMGATETASYEYDALGNVTYERRPDGTELWYEYDGRGRVEQVFTGSEALPEVLKVFEYFDDTAQVETASRIHRLDDDSTFGYFADHKGTVLESFTYDTNGLLATKNTKVLLDTPTETGRLLHDVNQSWLYDELGLVRQTDYPSCEDSLYCGPNHSGAPQGRSVERTYSNGILDSVLRDGLLLAAHDYHPNGMLKQVDHYRGGSLKTWDRIKTGPFGAATVNRVQHFTSANQKLWDSEEFFYNSRGNLRARGWIWAYTHDEFDRQDHYNRTGFKQDYHFDDYDNLLEIRYYKDNGSVAPSRDVFATDATNNRLQRVTNYEEQDDGQEIIKLDIGNIEYDARGQLVHFGRNFIGYDPFGKTFANLWERFDPNNSNPPANPDDGYDYQALHLYNASDERVVTVERRPEPTGDESLVVFFARDQTGDVLREFRWAEDDQGNPQQTYKEYYWGSGRLLGLEETTATTSAKLLHAHLDHLGSLVQLTDGQDTHLNQIQEFFPWGRHQSSGVIAQRIGFTGQEVDRNDMGAPFNDGRGLTLDFGARSYAPLVGRFSSPDPARDPSSWSLYGYAGNNPIMNNDPTGLECNAMTSATGNECRRDPFFYTDKIEELAVAYYVTFGKHGPLFMTIGAGLGAAQEMREFDAPFSKSEAIERLAQMLPLRERLALHAGSAMGGFAANRAASFTIKVPATVVKQGLHNGRETSKLIVMGLATGLHGTQVGNFLGVDRSYSRQELVDQWKFSRQLIPDMKRLAKAIWRLAGEEFPE